jgi:DNA polymerase III alpha subunit
MGHPEALAKEVWRQIESFAGYSFSKAHSASYAVESYQSLYLKSHYPLEFMVGVINNFGGFYATWVYVNEVKKAGGTLHLPCVNNSAYLTNLNGTDVYLGFIHIKSLEQNIGQQIEVERLKNGPFLGLEDFIMRTSVGLESLKILIRIDAFRFTGQNKRQLLWEAHMVFDKHKQKEFASTTALFHEPPLEWKLPQLAESQIANIYDEIELMGFPVTQSYYDLLKTKSRGDCKAKDLMKHLGKKVRILGSYVTTKPVRTVRDDMMAFGTFLDDEDTFFDTTHFSHSLKAYPFKSLGVYLILGKVVEEFGFPSIEVEKMAKLEIKGDPRVG